MARLQQVPAGLVAVVWVESFWAVQFTVCHLPYFAVALQRPSTRTAQESGDCMEVCGQGTGMSPRSHPPYLPRALRLKKYRIYW